MINKSGLWFSCVLTILFFCQFAFGQVPVTTIAEYEYFNYTVFQEAILIDDQEKLDSLLKNTGYDSTRAVIKLTGKPDFGLVTVFALIGWPSTVDTIIEKQDTIIIELSLNQHNTDIPGGSRPLDAVKICTINITGKVIVFVNNSFEKIKYRLPLSYKDKRILNISQKRFDLSGKVVSTEKCSNKIVIIPKRK